MGGRLESLATGLLHRAVRGALVQSLRHNPHMTKRVDIEAALRRLAPRIPAHEFGAVVDHALDSRGLRTATPESAAWLSLIAYVRHAFTDYDDLLTQGYDQDSARFFVRAEIEQVLASWGVRRALDMDQ
jgi:hypothetical protein